MWHNIYRWFKDQCIQIPKPAIPNDKISQKVKRIIKEGKTVQEVETSKLREKHQKALDEIKNDRQISDEEWNERASLFKHYAKSNPLFHPQLNATKENLDNSIHQLSHQWLNATSFLEARSITKEIIAKKLQKRGLNPHAVEVDFDSESRTGASQTREPLRNIIYLGPKFQTLNNADFNATLDHEITHLQENHPLEEMFKIWPYVPKNYNHIIEYEADLLYSLQDINAAKHRQLRSCITLDTEEKNMEGF